MTSKRHLQFFFAITKKSNKQSEINKLIQYLQKKEVLNYLEKFGFHNPEKLIHNKQEEIKNETKEIDETTSNTTKAVENK